MVRGDVRPRNVVARVAIVAALALVAVPGMAGSAPPSALAPVDPALFRAVEVGSIERTVTSTQLDPAFRSDGALDEESLLLEPAIEIELPERPEIDQPTAPTGVIKVPVWRFDREVSFYGPGFYGKRTACGLAYTTTLQGVAHRTLPCGTKVTFRNPANGRTITVPVIDRGPYAAGRQWDLSGATCTYLRHCYTGSLYWKFPG
jgi:hypothetical protein